MKIAEILEAFEWGSMPEIEPHDYQNSYDPLIKVSKKIADVRANLSLYLYSNRIYLLVKNEETVLGNLTVSPIAINGTQYLHVDGIFIRKDYRKTAALYWLVYAVKEISTQGVVADGAIFQDGLALIAAIQKHKSFNVHKLDLRTGAKSELDGPINSENFCYLFDSARIGFGKHFFEGTNLPFVWYPLFEELE